MSEYIDFSEQEFSDQKVHTEYARQVISELQSGICAFDSPMSWESADGSAMYNAQPLKFKEDSDDPIPYGRLKDLSLIALSQTMQSWMMRKVTLRKETGDLLQENFVITRKRALVTSAVGSLAVFEEGPQGDFARNALQDDLKSLKSTRPASVRDYANLDNALYDLQPYADERYQAYFDHMINMTPEEMRTHRAMKRDWIVQPEQDKTAPPKYWGITLGSMVWLVKASSAEEAVLDLEDHFDQKTEPFFMFFTDSYDEDIQEQLATRYEDGAIRRLIPFSLVEWPEDFDNPTDEQKAALDKLR